MKFGLVQFDQVWENKSENRNKLEHLLQLHAPSTDVLVFPEMTLTGFSMNPDNIAESLEGESVHFFSGIARSRSTHVIAGVVLNENGKYSNAMIHFDSYGNVCEVYRKMHPFSLAGEHNHYTAGESPVVFTIDGVRIGAAICYDLRFPELFRQYGKLRTDVILVIANWPVPRVEHWKLLLKARAVENLCYCIGVNRVGDDPAGSYNGYTSVIEPLGNEIAVASRIETVLTADIDPSLVQQTRAKFGFLNDIKMV